MIKLLDNNHSQSFIITPNKRYQREFFIGYGGVSILLQLFSKPFSKSDTRLNSEEEVSQISEIWNEVLVILRELVIAIPSLSEKLFDNAHIVYFCTLLAHQPMFDNTMNLLEEILASRGETFSLGILLSINTNQYFYILFKNSIDYLSFV